MLRNCIEGLWTKHLTKTRRNGIFPQGPGPRRADRTAPGHARSAAQGRPAAAGDAHLAGGPARHGDRCLLASGRIRCPRCTAGRRTASCWPSRSGAILPVVNREHKTLTFHAWYPGCPMENAYDIPRRQGHQADRARLLFVPCLGYSAGGYRLGYGGGYDRTLASLETAALHGGAGLHQWSSSRTSSRRGMTCRWMQS